VRASPFAERREGLRQGPSERGDGVLDPRLYFLEVEAIDDAVRLSTTTKARKAKTTTPAAPVVLTDAEKELVGQYFDRREKARPRAALKIDGKSGLTPDHADPTVGWAIIHDAFGQQSGAFVAPLLSQLANALSKGPDVDLQALNGAVAVVQAVKPRDPLEAMLVSQMVGINAAVMTFTRRLNHVDNIKQQDSALNGLVKLAQTYAAQMETLKRYRSAGDQKMTVEHVHVHAGGQAVVGNVQGGGFGGKSRADPMNRAYSFQKAPRCHATSKRTGLGVVRRRSGGRPSAGSTVPVGVVRRVGRTGPGVRASIRSRRSRCGGISPVWCARRGS
jgi:hypothetical protein